MKKQHLLELHQKISELENSNMDKEAQTLHEIFIKEADKKSKKKKNVPNNPSLWAECKAWAKRTFDVYPSAYANGAAAKRYKSKGGTWKKASSNKKHVEAQIKGGLDVTGTNVLDPSYGGIVPPVVDTKRDVLKEQNDRRVNLDSGIETEDPWSGYKEMPYKQVIETAKSWLMKGDKKNADAMIQAVTQIIRGSKELTPAQKDALKKHYERIKFSLQDTGRIGSGKTNVFYDEANDLIAKVKNQYNIKDSELTSDSPSYGFILDAINKYVGPIQNGTQRVKNIAYTLLRQQAMDNYRTMKQQGITPRG